MKLVKNVSLARFAITFSILGFLSVAIGAFGAHGLKSVLSTDMLAIFETGNKYHFYHSLAGLLVVLFAHLNLSLPETDSNLLRTSKRFNRASLFFTIGIVVFSGSLYTLAITGIRTFGAITPIGGVCFLLGWIFFGLGLYSFLVPKK